MQGRFVKRPCVPIAERQNILRIFRKTECRYGMLSIQPMIGEELRRMESMQ